MNDEYIEKYRFYKSYWIWRIVKVSTVGSVYKHQRVPDSHTFAHRSMTANYIDNKIVQSHTGSGKVELQTTNSYQRMSKLETIEKRTVM